MKNKVEREKIADVRLANIAGRRNYNAHSFTSLMSGLCTQSLVSSSSGFGWPNERYCYFSQQTFEPGFQDQQSKWTQQYLVSHRSLLL